MSRIVNVAAAQLGPVQRDHSRADVVSRLIELLHEAHRLGAELVVYPELALTTFFPRWWEDDRRAADHWFETAMPGPDTQPLFDEAARLHIRTKSRTVTMPTVLRIVIETVTSGSDLKGKIIIRSIGAMLRIAVVTSVACLIPTSLTRRPETSR